MLAVVNYHYVRERFDYPHEGIFGIRPDVFKKQLQLLMQIGQFVSGPEIRAAVRGDAPLPPRSFLMTADDGLREHYEVVRPIMKELGVPGIFFVSTEPILRSSLLRVHKIHLLRAHVPPADFLELLRTRSAGDEIPLAVDESIRAKAVLQYRYDSPDAASLKYLLNFVGRETRRDAILDEIFAEVFPDAEARMSRELYMSIEQLQSLPPDIAIGNHSHEHLPLASVSPAETRRQLELCSNHLQTWTGRRPYAVAYPYGSRAATNESVARIAAELGHDFGFTMERGINADLTEPLLLGRFDTNDVPGGKSYLGTVDEFFETAPARKWYGQ